jgi:hypothetical protein
MGEKFEGDKIKLVLYLHSQFNDALSNGITGENIEQDFNSQRSNSLVSTANGSILTNGIVRASSWLAKTNKARARPRARPIWFSKSPGHHHDYPQGRENAR